MSKPPLLCDPRRRFPPPSPSFPASPPCPLSAIPLTFPFSATPLTCGVRETFVSGARKADSFIYCQPPGSCWDGWEFVRGFVRPNLPPGEVVKRPRPAKSRAFSFQCRLFWEVFRGSSPIEVDNSPTLTGPRPTVFK